jgi:putative ABC transport system substrate-binding protein
MQSVARRSCASCASLATSKEKNVLLEWWQCHWHYNAWQTLGGKRLELLKDTIARLSRVAVLTDPGTGGHGPQTKELEVAAPALALQLQAMEVRAPAEFESAFSAMIGGRAGAFIALQQPTLDRVRQLIVDLAAKNRLPGMYPNDEYVESGGLSHVLRR